MSLVLLVSLLGPPEADASPAPGEQLELPARASAPTPGAAAEQPEPRPAPDASPSEPAPAPEPEPEPEHTWQAELNIDTAYGFNSNLPDNHLTRMTVTPRSGEMTIGAVGAFVRHPLRDDQPWLFEFGLRAGAAVDALTASEPNPGGPDGKFAGTEVFKHIAVANAGFALRRAKTTFAAGVFESPIGFGTFWTHRNWNYTTSWELNTVPYYLTGLRITQPLPRGFELAGWVVNGFQSFADNNNVPSGMLALNWTRPKTPVPPPRTGSTSTQFATHVYFGPEGTTAIGPKDWRLYWDTWVVYDFDDHFSLAGVFDLGLDRVGREDERAPFGTLALFSRGTIFEGKRGHLDLALRPEALWDPRGRFTGTEHWLFAGTGTLTFTLFEHLFLRAEYRFDHSTARNGFFFRREFTHAGAPGLAQDQHTVFLSLAANWSFWFGGKRS
jgi:hypothetical protein